MVDVEHNFKELFQEIANWENDSGAKNSFVFRLPASNSIPVITRILRRRYNVSVRAVAGLTTVRLEKINHERKDN